MTGRWESTQVDGKTMRIDLGVPNRRGPRPGIVVAQHAFQNFLAERHRERAARGSWHGMLAFFAEHLKRVAAD